MSELLDADAGRPRRAFGDGVWVRVSWPDGPSDRREDGHLCFDLIESRDDGRVAGSLPVVLFAGTGGGSGACSRAAAPRSG